MYSNKRIEWSSVYWMSTGCDSGWLLKKGSCYLAITHVSKNYRDAEEACRKAHGYLAEIQTSEENSFVAGLTSHGNVWIGYNDRSLEGNWIWTNTGKDGSYTNWKSGEPNNDGDQDCAHLWSGQNNPLWDDIQCHHNQWFVCEKGRPSAVQ